MQEIATDTNIHPYYFQNPQLDPSPIFHRGNEIGVLLIHGYTATPIEVSLLANYLSDIGYTVSCPLLPGHGSRIENLHLIKWKDWADHVETKYAELKSDCTSIFVGGESLGSLLSIYLGNHHPEITGLILNAPALYPKNRLAYLSPVMKYFIKTRKKKRGSLRTAVDQRWQGYNVDSLPAISQVLILQRTIQHSLAEINQPTIIFQGLLDETIRPEGAQEIYERISSSDKALEWMENSTHCVLLNHEWETIAEKTIEFIERITGR